MGSCGCEPTAVGRLKGPGKLWYVLEVYPGCTECGTDWGLGVTGIETGSEDWEWRAEDVPVAELDATYRMWGMPILKTAVLKRMFMEAGQYEDEYEEAPEVLGEFIRRGGLIRLFHESRAPDAQPSTDAQESQP